ncbi:hypothetical protein [Trinickia mobilis]|uniref:hypothetical protein n=1 Tax=Trinickia mobilis TaxID=2816356 RepID=UPI001A8FC864|nr:hypothetical protein [Trinickia mobilis]
MNVRELARLRTLYVRLARAERWISAVASQMNPVVCRNGLSSHHTSTSARGVGKVRRVRERVLVYCCSHASDDEAVVAVLNCGQLLRSDPTVSGATEDGTSVSLPPPLSDLRGSRLFRELHEGCLNGNWDRLLEIDGIRIELSSACCWGPTWS